MKKITIAMVLAIVCGAAYADFTGPVAARGGFNDGNSNNGNVSVAQAKEMRDDSYVAMQGNIVSKMKHDKYLFQDSTGSMTVEIDGDDWRGVTVSPTDTVRIVGEVDRGMFSTEVDVEYIQKI